MLQHVAAEPVDELEVDGEVEALELTTQVRLDLAHRVIEPTRRHQPPRGLIAVASSPSTVSKSSSAKAIRTSPAGEAASRSSPMRVSTVR